MGNSDWAEFEDAECIKETDKAILVTIDGDEYWIPSSLVSDDSEVWKEGDTGTLVIPQWLAEERGLA